MIGETKKVDVIKELDFVASLYRDGTHSYARAIEARDDIAELIAKAGRFGQLFEAWHRNDESVPTDLQATTESEVIAAMYDMRATVARIGGAA